MWRTSRIYWFAWDDSVASLPAMMAGVRWWDAAIFEAREAAMHALDHVIMTKDAYTLPYHYTSSE